MRATVIGILAILLVPIVLLQNLAITASFWNTEWAKANADLAHKVMVAYLKAARDLAAVEWNLVTKSPAEAP